MPIILRCDQCGKETRMSYPSNQGWQVKPQIGGTEVLCPDHKQKNVTTEQPVDVVKMVNVFKKLEAQKETT